MALATKRQPDSVLAWHFVGGTLRDGRPIPADGEVLRHDGPMVLCESGLHASVRALYALKYAPGATVCRVCMADEIQHESDKLIARERTILWRLNATDVLRVFSRQCALDVAHLWTMPKVVRRYLETGDEELRAAALAGAAAAAAHAAAAAARAAAHAVADVAARAAACAAACAAADAAAYTDAYTDARAAQSARLEAAIYAAAGRTPEDDQ